MQSLPGGTGSAVMSGKGSSEIVAALDELTKRQARRLLVELGAPSGGARTSLIERLAIKVPAARLFRSRGSVNARGGTLELLDGEGQAIDLAPLQEGEKVVEEAEPVKIDLSIRYPGARVVRANEVRALPQLVVTAPRDIVKSSLNPNGGGEQVCSKDSTAETCEDGSVIPFAGRVTLVLGRTASGKSNYLKSRWPQTLGLNVDWDRNRAIISQFGDEKQGIKWLLAVGLTSVPSWCKPFHILSTGERYRAATARRLQLAYESKDEKDRLLILDNFTSQLDRVTARACAAALAKQVRRLGIGCVLGASALDIVPWIQPDVIVSCDYGRVPRAIKIDSCRKGPKVCVVVSEQKVCNWLLEHQDSAATAQDDPNDHAMLGSAYYNGPLQNVNLPALKESFQFSQEAGFAREKGDGTVLSTCIERDDATRMCDTLFDRPFDGECTLHVPDIRGIVNTKDFTLGVITGASGSAKSVVLREYFGQPSSVQWQRGASLQAHFLCPDKAVELLDIVCLVAGDASAILTRAYEELSGGERELADLARLLEQPQDGVCVDEFTSGLDRALAIRVAANVSRFLSKERIGGRFVFVTCHADVLEYLAADWVFDTTHYHCTRGSVEKKATEFDVSTPVLDIDAVASCGLGKIAAPDVRLRLERCQPWLWALFRDHHYKTSTLSQKARTFALREESSGSLVGFVATIQQIGSRKQQTCAAQSEGSHKIKRRRTGQEDAQKRSSWRAHRTVVLPAWQGLGIGSRLSDACAEIHHRCGSAYLAQTVHPRFGSYRDASPLWRPTEWNHTLQKFKIESWRQRLDNTRVKLRVPKFIYAHEYIGSRLAAEKTHPGSLFLHGRVNFD